jgi:hypothetical protein
LSTSRLRRSWAAAALLLAAMGPAAAQSGPANMLLPPGTIPNLPTQAAPVPAQKPAAPPLTRSIGPLPLGNVPTSANPAVPQPAAVVPPGLGAISASARFGKDSVTITSGLHWRVYADKPDDTGVFRMIKEDRGATPSFVLPQGSYIVHVSFGLANAVRRVQVRTETVREVFEIAAGGVRFEGRVSDARIPAGQITFDVYKGGQLEPGDRRPLASEVATGDLVLLPEGNYHVVSNYGDGNAVIRSDFRIQAAKLTDARINHRAAIITLKLVGDRGGEALANTAWSVLTPGGDVIKESIGAFPTVVLAEGEYVAIARNEGKVFNREFKVEPGFDREIELLAR